MKKILSIIFSSVFLMTSAYAGGMIGIKAGFGTLDGERTIDAEKSDKNLVKEPQIKILAITHDSK